MSAAVAGSAAAINTGAGATWIQILNFGPCRSQAVLLLSEGRRGRLVSSKKPAAGSLPVGCSGGLERATCPALGFRKRRLHICEFTDVSQE